MPQVFVPAVLTPKPWRERVVHSVGDLLVDMPERHLIYYVGDDCQSIVCRARPDFDDVLAGQHRRLALVPLSLWSIDGFTDEGLVRDRVRAIQEVTGTDLVPTLLVDAVDRRRKALYLVLPERVRADFLANP